MQSNKERGTVYFKSTVNLICMFLYVFDILMSFTFVYVCCFASSCKVSESMVSVSICGSLSFCLPILVKPFTVTVKSDCSITFTLMAGLFLSVIRIITVTVKLLQIIRVYFLFLVLWCMSLSVSFFVSLDIQYTS